MMLSVMLVGGTAFGMKVKTDYDRSFDFGRLRTFAFADQRWPDGSRLQRNGLENGRIREALKRDLERRGFRYQPDSQADFLVAYYARGRERVEIEPVAYGMPYRWRWGWGPRVWARDYTQGSVVVDVVDQARNQLIWRGRVTDTVKGLDQSEKQIDKGVDRLVKHFSKDTRKAS
jgi:hypothetical protein